MRLWIIAICGLLAVHLAACGDFALPAVPSPTSTPVAVSTEPPESPAEPTPEPTATETPESAPDSTDSVSSTPTPTASPEAPGHGRTQPVGAGVTVTTSDGLGLTVVSARLDAAKFVLAADSLNDPPASGNRYTVVRVRIENLDGPVDGEKSIDSSQFRLVGSSGRVFSTLDHTCGVVPDELSLSLFGGGRGEGNVCFEIPNSESDLVLFYEPSEESDGSERRWLKVDGPDAEEPERSAEMTPEPAPEEEPDPQLEHLGLHSYRLSQDLALSPAFDDTVLSYTTSVPYEAVQITVTAVSGIGTTSAFVEDDGVTVQSDADVGLPGHQVKLVPGENIIMVKAAAGQASQIYAITVVRDKPTVNLIAQATAVGEGHVLEFTVLRTPVATDDLEVTLGVGESGDFVRAGEEGTKTVSIPASAASATHTVLTDPDDDAWDLHSIVSVTLEAEDHYTVGSDHLREVEVRDDDFPQTVAVLRAHPNPVAEGGRVTATFTLTTVSDQEPHSDGGSIEMYASDGKATVLQDYEACRIIHAITPQDFRPVEVGGSRRYRATFSATYNTVEDAIEEGVEEFSVMVVEPGEDMISLLEPSRVDIFISEDVQSAGVSPEPAPEANGSQGPQLENLCLAHGEPSEAIALTPFFDSSAFTYAASVPYEVLQATVTVIADADVRGILVEEDGVTVRPDADSNSPGHQVALTPGDNLISVRAVGGGASQIFTINVVRARPTVNVRVWTGGAVREGYSLRFTVERGLVVPDALEVLIDVGETGDFVDESEEGTRSITIEANASAATHIVSTDADDDVWDPHSAVTVTVQADDAYTVGSARSAKIEIEDDDFPETVAVLTAHPNQVAEGETVTVILTLTTVLDQEPHLGGGSTQIGMSARDGTATSPQDFESWGTVYLVVRRDFSPIDVDGERRYRAVYREWYRTFEDDLEEGDETFIVRIGDPFNPKISLGEPSSVTIVISE